MRHKYCECAPGRHKNLRGHVRTECEGARTYCFVCESAGDEIPTECPGYVMGPSALEAVAQKLADFKDGSWVALIDYDDEDDDDYDEEDDRLLTGAW